MQEKERAPQFQKGDNSKKGLEPEMSLLSVNFATTENEYLNEHYQEETKKQE